MNYLGIDIGGTAVKIGLVSNLGHILLTNEYPVAFDYYETPILTTVLKSCDEFIDENHILLDTISGIGISATGQIDTKHGIVAGVGGNIKNWKGSKLVDAFEKKYHKHTTVVNDANCVAIGEYWRGNAQGYKCIVTITVGTGIGGGVITESDILLGSQGFAGEFGHFSIEEKGLLCTCGNLGCYEQYSSMNALIKSVKNILPLTDNPDLTYDKLNGKLIFELLADGNPHITQLVDEWITHISTGLISLTHIFNPDLILIGGGICTQEELFICKIREKVLSHVMERFKDNLEIKGASLGNRAGLAGAVYYCIKH